MDPQNRSDRGRIDSISSLQNTGGCVARAAQVKRLKGSAAQEAGRTADLTARLAEMAEDARAKEDCRVPKLRFTGAKLLKCSFYFCLAFRV